MAVLVVAGCGSADPAPGAAGTTTTDPAATSSVAAPAPLPAQPPLPAATTGRVLGGDALTAALLPVTALPAGFAVDDTGSDPAGDPTTSAPATPGAPAPEGSTSVVGTTTPPACGRVLDPVAGLAADPAGRAQRSFTGADAFTSVTEDVASWPGRGALDALAAVRDTAAGCARFTSTDADGVPGSYTLGALDGLDASTDGLGADAVTALRVVGTSQGVAAVFDVVVAVVGSAAVQVVVVGLDPLPTDQLRAVVAAATDRLRTAQG
ncbi:hypothetical protein GCM10027047_17740 [Rhodococcus aerolatus]